jgi:hypothetical protein
MVGAPGTVAGGVGVTLADAAEAALGPTTLLALTVHVTVVPFVSGLTMIGEIVPFTVTAPQVAL